MAQLCDELVLIKFAPGSNRKEILQVMKSAGAIIADASPEFLTFKLIDNADNIEKLMQRIQKYAPCKVLRS